MNKADQITEYYNKKYTGLPQTSRNGELRLEIMTDFVGTKKKVLDIGCDDGFFMRRLIENGNIAEGLDISDRALKSARKYKLKIHRVNLEDTWPTRLNNKFDLVVAGEIIEHIYDTDLFLEKIVKVLKPKGELVVSTPNVATLGRRIMLLLGKNPLLDTTLRVTDAGHIRYFTFKDLIKLLNEHGFKISKSSSTVINFDIKGKLNSRFLAEQFPTLGSSIIIKAKLKK